MFAVTKHGNALVLVEVLRLGRMGSSSLLTCASALNNRGGVVGLGLFTCISSLGLATVIHNTDDVTSRRLCSFAAKACLWMVAPPADAAGAAASGTSAQAIDFMRAENMAWHFLNCVQSCRGYFI